MPPIGMNAVAQSRAHPVLRRQRSGHAGIEAAAGQTMTFIISRVTGGPATCSTAEPRLQIRSRNAADTAGDVVDELAK
jgi:hypothetical protein